MGEKTLDRHVGPHTARFGKAVRRCREDKDWSQTGLAQRCTYVGSGMISAIEAGKRAPSLEMAFELAAALGTTIDEMVSGVGTGPLPSWPPSEVEMAAAVLLVSRLIHVNKHELQGLVDRVLALLRQPPPPNDPA